MAVASPEEKEVRPGTPGLKRQIGFVGLIWASTGSIIGSGWLFGAQRSLPVAGPAAIISWCLGGVAILILALVHAELGAMWPVAGGTARFPHYTYGGFAGASFGWFSYLQAATVAPIEVAAMITYAQHYSWAHSWVKPSNGLLTGTGVVVAVVLMAILSSVNFLGIRILAHTNSTITWWKVGVPLLTIFVVAITNFNTSNFSTADGWNPDGAHGILSAIALSGIIFSYLGFEQADQFAGESSNPQRDIPGAVIGSILIGMVIYIGLQVVFIAALPSDKIGATWATVHSGLYTAFTGPWAELASAVSLGWLATILYIDAVISPGGTGLIYTAATSRVSYGLSRNGYVPVIFERTNKAGVPWFGVIVSFVLGCICFLPFPSWQSLVGLITGASVLMYAGAPLSLGALRRRLPDAPRPFRLPGAEIISPLAFIVANLIILWTGWTTDWKLGVAILIGYAILFVSRVLNLNEHPPLLNWSSAVWLPVYLVGMGLVVYFSTFGGRGDLKLWWDMLVVAIFSLVIYYWAISVALPTQTINEMVEEVVVPEEAEVL